MLNALKVKLLLNAVKDFKLKAVIGGEGRFQLKGFKLKHKGMVIQVGEISFKYSFPVGDLNIEQGVIKFDREVDAIVNFMVKDLTVNENGGEFALELIELNSASSVKEFLLDLPFKEMVEAIAIS